MPVLVIHVLLLRVKEEHTNKCPLTLTIMPIINCHYELSTYIVQSTKAPI